LAVLIGCFKAAAALDLGVVGPVYPIAEADLLSVIEARLQALQRTGALARLEGEMRDKAARYAARPAGTHLPRAVKPRVRSLDPSLTVPNAITDHTGRVIHPAGTRVNPLQYLTLSRRLVFFDGDDPAQVTWARENAKDRLRVKPILVNGPLGALTRAWQRRLYFDQGGRLVAHFRIERLPAVVAQEGERLRIEEIALEEGTP
jgi:conjugal transfer pilus assembly protein TraW